VRLFSRDIRLVSRDITLVSRDITPVSRDITLVSRDITLVSRDITLVDRNRLLRARPPSRFGGIEVWPSVERVDLINEPDIGRGCLISAGGA
jgi:hypothetical protein